MSEVNEELSRPAFQRYELAPLLALTTRNLITTAEAIAPLCFDVYQPLSVAEITNHEAVVNLGYMLQKIAETAVYSRAPFMIDNAVESLVAQGKYVGQTFYKDDELHEEGFKSGLVMPIKLYGLLLDKGLFGCARNDLFNVKHFEETAGSGWFDEMLHQLADLPNGQLEEWSTEGHKAALTNSLVYELSYKSFGGGFDFDEKSKAILKQILAGRNAYCRKLKRLNQATSRQESGGCPGRHTTFKRIGENALVALMAAGVDVSEFQEEARDSIITISRNFVVETVKKFFDELYIETS